MLSLAGGGLLGVCLPWVGLGLLGSPPPDRGTCVVLDAVDAQSGAMVLPVGTVVYVTDVREVTEGWVPVELPADLPRTPCAPDPLGARATYGSPAR